MTKFVAEFIGETNFVDATVSPEGLCTSFCVMSSSKQATGTDVTCSIRPEAIDVCNSPMTQNGFSGTCIETIYLGEVAQHQVVVDGDCVLRVMEVNPGHLSKVGDTMHLHVDPKDVIPLSN